jgi:hypothetical protein
MAQIVKPGGLSETQHNALDHSGVTGIPNVSGLLDETLHYGINHQDVTGVPSYMFVGVHATEEQFFVGVISTFGDDPTPDGAYGFVGSAGAYTKYLYLNGVWETYEVHGEFDWDTDAATPYKTAHDATDHAGLKGIPSIAGLLDETAHDGLDHTGLTGVPSITGLLDETAHDLLDHDGIDGVGSMQWINSVDTYGSLPQDGVAIFDTNPVEIEQNLTDLYSYLAISPAHLEAIPFIPTVDVATIDVIAVLKTDTAGTAKVTIFSDNGNKPGSELKTQTFSVSTYAGASHTYTTSVSYSFIANTKYWVSITRITAATGFQRISNALSDGYTWAQYGSSWSTVTNGRPPQIRVQSSTVVGYVDGTISVARDTGKIYKWNSTARTWSILNPTEAAHTGLLDETAHDALDHTGLTGVGGGSEYFNDPVADYANLPAVDNDDGDVRVALNSHKMYVWDAGAATPCWRESFTVVTTSNITVDPSSWRYFTVNLIDTAVADFKCLIAKIKITAIDGNATPDMNYGIDLFTDSGRSVYAYAASDITSVIYEDRVPFIWEGSNVIYGRMTNAKAAGITDCDVEITWMV